MLRSIELDSFKAFGTATSIPLAPITLLYGQNSSGKSSILQSLNMLKQTRESRDSGAVLLPRSKNGVVDLGSFQELVFDHDLDRSFSIKLEYDWEKPIYHPIRRVIKNIGEKSSVKITFSRPTQEDEVSISSIDFYTGDGKIFASFEPAEATKEMKRDLIPYRMERRIPLAAITVAKCSYLTRDAMLWESGFEFSQNNKENIIDALQNSLNRQDYKNNEQHSLLTDDLYETTKDELSQLRKALRFYQSNFSLEDYIERMHFFESKSFIGLDGFIPFGAPTNSWSAPEIRYFKSIRGESLTLNVGRIATFSGRVLDSTLERVFPLGPFRRPPERWYLFTGSNPRDVGYRGDLMPDLLFRKPKVLRETNEWLKRLDIGYKIKIVPLAKRVSDLFEVRLVDTRRSKEVEVCLSDVGFGISQLLPFVVQSLAANNQVITIEQPEVHIHPRLQADLGDLLVEAISSRRDNQFIIETHSEHLVLRIQKLIRNKQLTPNQVSVLAVHRGKEGSEVRKLRLDEQGDFIDEWPGGFFPERLNELL
ncbi:AAA family ATPase [Pseudodesulfovibrio sp. JC047]|uniref:AAA family ATPase n=1 Tax=Pseudodesulfovibrio sp. JC047 TaxID=2683199 RepID=UPI0013D7A4C3|nr:AAA family ATPase [Pseudodesulfovibrio sp. JC047]NDV18271.1 AAA family ATPase [Pseudodesulfovibrio sp. JC047]